MFVISRTTPAYFLTSVCHNRLPVFQTDKIKQIVCAALDEARRSSGIRIFAFVIMPDHHHLITDASRSIAETLRYMNGITARRVIGYLMDNGYESSLAKLRIQLRERKHKHALFEHHSNAFEIFGEDTMMQKVNYVHLNPMRAGLVDDPMDYVYSSARQWSGRVGLDEPLVTNHREIKWRHSRRG